MGLPLLLALSMGATNCDDFETVTVPATDTSPPNVFDGAYSGEYKTLVEAPGTETYHIPSGTDAFAVGSGVDPGGVSKVELWPSLSFTCCSGHVCSGGTPDFPAPSIATQSGSVGSQVSDGVYTFILVEAPEASDYCGAGETFSWDYSWHTEAWDFHGNHTTGITQHIVYP
ncbi:MAG TPA: hypothetical protein VGM88_21415 [Kofleriaceae bacterium]